MGYYIRTIEGNITIPAEKRAGALAALKARLLARESAYYGGDKRELAANDPLYSAETLAEALNQFYIGYDEYEDDGSLRIYNFEGKQSIGFDEIGRALAGFATAGDYLVFLGEDTDQWRWYYTAKNFYLQTATITWPQVDEEEEENNA